MNRSWYAQHKKGFALLLSIIIASVVLAIGIALLKISISQLQLSATGRESETAFQAAQSMAECLMYHRYHTPDWFTAKPGDVEPPNTPDAPAPLLNAPVIDCMGGGPIESSASVIQNTDGHHVVKFHYVYDWGSPDQRLCSSGDMYVMVPLDDSWVSLSVPGASFGPDGDGRKQCPAGSICTIFIVQGYNRPCAELQSSLFAVQRELTIEN